MSADVRHWRPLSSKAGLCRKADNTRAGRGAISLAREHPRPRASDSTARARSRFQWATNERRNLQRDLIIPVQGLRRRALYLIENAVHTKSGMAFAI